MKVLVTGANGHIGANVCRELLRQGHEVRAFVRRSADMQGLQNLAIDVVYGDVMDALSLNAGAMGCDAIIHLAAVYKTIASTPEEIVAPAVEGSRNVFSAAKQAGIKRIVYTSSIASIGFSDSPDQMRSGADWNEDAQNPYYIAKTQSEKVAQQLSRDYDIELIVLCPALVLGAFDYRITPSNQLIRDLVTGKGQTYRGGMNLVDVRDVAAIHVAALTKGENRKRYVVGGGNIEVKKIGAILARCTGVKPLHLPTSRSFTLVMAGLIERCCKLFGIKPPLTRDLVYEVVERFGYYDTSDTRATFGVEPRAPEESIKAALEWLIQQGQFKPALVRKIKEIGLIQTP
jgi:dihydroflavonol-4-reductase